MEFPMPLPHSCLCGEPIDVEGHHLCVCRHMGGIIPHNDVAHLLSELMRAADYWVGGEQSMRHIHEDGSAKCPDLLMSPRFSSEDPIAVDVTIRNPVGVKNWVAPLSAAKQGEVDKRKKHEAACISSRLRFIPFSIEFFGALGPAAEHLFLSLISELDPDKFVAPNWAARSSKCYWLQRLSVSLINGECRRVLSLRKQSMNAMAGMNLL